MDADIPAVQGTIAQIANTISRFEPVVMLVTSQSLSSAEHILSQDIRVWHIPVDDRWCRDSGSTFVGINGSLAIADLNFNGWGGKQIHSRDRKVAMRFAARLGLAVINHHLVGEAGRQRIAEAQRQRWALTRDHRGSQT